MAIIVDKVQKRKDIALSCKEIFFQNGINGLTISQIAKTAGVGKGTIYEYFKNKEDIVFEIVNILIQERNTVIQDQILRVKTTKEKVKLFTSFFYSAEDEKLRQLYKEFVSISLLNPDSQMIEYQSARSKDYFTWFESIIEAGIASGELTQNAREFIKGMFSVPEGMFIKHTLTKAKENLQEEINQFFDALFTLLEVKE